MPFPKMPLWNQKQLVGTRRQVPEDAPVTRRVLGQLGLKIRNRPTHAATQPPRTMALHTPTGHRTGSWHIPTPISDATPSPSPDKGRPSFVNPDLRTVRDAGHKHYEVHGVPVCAPYRQKPAAAPESSDPWRSLVGSGTSCVLRRRSNPEASVYVKRSFTSDFVVTTAMKCGILNELVRKLSETSTDAHDAAMKEHFAPEVLKELDASGRAVYYTPIVRGFSLDRYFANPDAFRDVYVLSDDMLLHEADRLKEAVRWLFSKGFVHGDVHRGNVMFDTDKRKLVLIDFENDAALTDDAARLRNDLSKVDSLFEARVQANAT
jgi:hypothetical protein